MKKTFFLVSILSILLFRCSEDDNTNQYTFEPVDNFHIQSYHGFYAIYGGYISSSYDGDNKVKFIYDDQNRIIERIGDIVYTSYGSGAGGYLHDSLYTDITYETNKAILIKKIHPFGGFSHVPENEQIITFDSRGRMIKKVSDHVLNRYGTDTINYTYQNDKLVEYTKTYNYDNDYSDFDIRYFEESNLYYTNNNLDSIVSVLKRKYSDEPYIAILSKRAYVFSGYDSSENPFRKLSMFDETFFRSLSRNNFSEYRVKSSSYYYPNDDYIQGNGYYRPYQETRFQSWPFAYDENNEWIYDNF
ncbi:hypothetical protein [Corallibacter sp.]|uniref:hypothetical protein n=1 Tax=Corallibacter sp. TaxID=2038084 RepID=UPI003A8CB796